MQIVIEIPDTLKKIIDSYDIKTASHPLWVTIMIDAIENGTPVQSAHWTLYRDYENMIDYPQCDNCGAVIKLPLPINNLNFCPNCGRKIEEE